MKTRVVNRPGKVGQIMHRQVVSISADTIVGDAARLFVEHRISGAPVVDAQGKLLGVVSLVDIARALPKLRAEPVIWNCRPDFYRDVWDDEVAHVSVPKECSLKVRDVMSRNAFTVDESEPIGEAANLMLEAGIHRLIVTSNGKMVGIISSMDILRLVPGVLGND